MVTKYSAPRRRAGRSRETGTAYAASAAAGPTREISAGEFKARCLALMDEVQRSGGEYVITKRGVPVARLLPARVERRPLLGSLKGSVVAQGDIVSPVDEPWSALEGWDGED
ncbi:MAG: type II toxin-antitoxin system Phd/YefM family antitoxin [Vicinamibacterales bacterium]